MKKINKHIEIVRSSTSRLSSMSAASADALLAVLRRHYTDAGITIVNDVADMEALVAKRPDLVFLTVQFVPLRGGSGAHESDKIWVADYLETHDIAYTGSARAALELQHNKPLAKQRVLDAGLKTPAFSVIRQGQEHAEAGVHIGFPMFIKPTDRGGGVGIDSDSVVHSLEALTSKVRAIAGGLQSDSLLEEYLPGREFSVALLKDERSEEYLAMPLELIAQPDKNGMRLLSKQVKSANTEQVTAVTDPVLNSLVSTLALNVFQALGARDYGRIDIRLDGSGTPHFLEANLLPSLISGYGSFPKACALHMGIHYEAMVLRIVRLGLMRSLNEGAAMLEPMPALGSVMPSLEAAFIT